MSHDPLNSIIGNVTYDDDDLREAYNLGKQEDRFSSFSEGVAPAISEITSRYVRLGCPRAGEITLPARLVEKLFSAWRDTADA